MYNVNWNASRNGVVLELNDFILTHSLAVFKTPLEGQYVFVLSHKGTGVRMAEGGDIAFAVRKTIAEQLLLDNIRKDPELGVEHPADARHDGLSSFGTSGGGRAN